MAVPLAQLKAAGVDESTETGCRGLAGITGSHKGAVSDLRTLAENPHTFFLQVGVEPGVPRHQLRHLAPFALLRFYRRHVRIAAAPGTAVAWAGPSTPALLSRYRSELGAWVAAVAGIPAHPFATLPLLNVNVPHSIPSGDHPPGYAAHAVANTAVVSTRIFRAGIAPAAVPGPRSDHESVVRLIILSMGSRFDFRLDKGGKVQLA
jgi:hypothetical protein